MRTWKVILDESCPLREARGEECPYLQEALGSPDDIYRGCHSASLSIKWRLVELIENSVDYFLSSNRQICFLASWCDLLKHNFKGAALSPCMSSDTI